MNTTKPIVRQVSALLSYILHPVFMPLAAMLILLFSHTYLSYLPVTIKSFDLILVALNTVLIPLMYMFLLRHTGFIGSFRLDTRKERYMPLSLYLIFTFITFWVLKKVHQPVIIYDLFLGLSFTMFFTLMISFRWKISLHMVGIGGFSGLLFAATYRLGHVFFLYLWLGSLVVSGLLATARLVHGSHNPPDIYTGFFLGYLVMAGILLFF